jgi:N-acylneuraminate cytidylyltransferase
LKKIALIPARSLSKRIPNKNIKLLGNHPLLAYSICSAIESKIFDKVVCITDSLLYAEIASYYGAEVPFLRPKEISTDESSDIEWVNWILLDIYKDLKFDIYSILRPTSPFRTKDTIIKAFKVFQNLKEQYKKFQSIQVKCGLNPEEL